LLLPVGSELRGFGGRQLAGAAGVARCRTALAPQLELKLGESGHDRRYRTTGWRGGVYSLPQGVQQYSPLTEIGDGAGDFGWPTTTGVIVGRLRSDNSRFMATSEDEDLVALLADGEPLGAKVLVRASEYGNRVSLK